MQCSQPNSLGLNDYFYQPDLFWTAVNQNIVWEGTIGAINSHIFLYNITSEVITNVSIQNGNSSNANSLPKIDGENIIWHGSDGGENHIYNYNISSGIVTKVSAQNSFNLISNCGAQIHNEHIVWHGFDGIDSHIFQYHIPTGTTTKISSLNGNISTNNSDPLITNDIIGWIGYFGTTRKLLIYDKATSSINTTDYNLHVASIFSIDGSKTLILGENSELIYNDQTKLTVLSFQTSHSCDITQSNIKLSDNKILFDNLIAGTHNLYLATCPCIEN